MIVGVGSDIVDVRRVARVAAVYPRRFGERVLAESELRCWRGLGGAARVRFLAGRWAAKEALGKALGCGMRAPVTWRQVAVVYEAGGRPGFELSAAAAAVARGRCHLSICHDGNYACAFVVVEREEL